MSLRSRAVAAAIVVMGLSSPSAAQQVDSSSVGGIGGANQPVSGTDPGTIAQPVDSVLDPRLVQPLRPGTVQQDVQPRRQLGPILQLVGEAPKWLHVTATAARSVSLSWSPTAGSSGYWIHRADTTGKFYRGSALVTDTITTVTYLLPGTSYSFKVSAVYPPETQRSEGFSEAVSATTGSATFKARR
jgi:hypothetical protein